MKSSELKNLIAVRKTINNLEGAKCGMVHESVAFDSSSKLPIANEADVNAYKRNNLCPAEIRNKRLACGHTNVRNYLKTIISALNNFPEFNSSEIKKLFDRVDKLDVKICTLDHQKGFAEYEYAAKLEEVFKQDKPKKSVENIVQNDLNNEKEKIEEIEKKHATYVDDMLEIKNDILKTIDEVINKESAKLKNKILLKLS